MNESDDARLARMAEALAHLEQRQEEILKRLERLEAGQGAARAEPEPPPPPPPPPSRSWAEPKPEPPQAEAQRAEAEIPAFARPEEPRPASPAFETRMGLTWVNRIGVVTLVLGAAFFFKYAVESGWIGVWARLLIGAAAGLGALALGERSRRSHVVYAQGIAGAGIGILYLTVYAAFALYRVVGQGPALLLMTAITAAAVMLSLRYGSAALAALGLVGGYLTPLLLGAAGLWFVLGYVLLLEAAAVYLARRRGWRPLEALALAGTVWVYLAQVQFPVPPEQRAAATVFALAYYGLFAGFGPRAAGAIMQVLAAFALAAIWTPGLWPYAVLALLVAGSGLVLADRAGSPLPVIAGFWISFAHWYSGNAVSAGEVFWFVTAAFALFAAWLPWRIWGRRAAAGAQDLAVVAFNAGLYFAVSYYLLGPHFASWRGLLAVVLAGVHIEMAWRLSRRDARAALFAAGVAAALLVLAAPAQFSGYRLTVVWALEAAALAWIGARVRQPRAVEASLAVFALALFRLLCIDSWAYPPAAYSAVVNARFLTFLLAAACLWVAARWLGKNGAATVLYVAGHFAVLWALALEVFGWAARNAAAANVQNVSNTGLSIVLAGYALLLVGIGVLTGTALNRALGLGLIAIVVAKLYLYDVWLLGLFYRMAAFAVLGLLLLVMSYVYSRWRQRHAS